MILAALRRPYCIPASPKLPEKVLIAPGNAFPTRALAPAKIIHFASLGAVPTFIAAIPTTRLDSAKIIAGIT